MDIIAHDKYVSSMNVDLSFFDKQKISFKIKTTTLNDLLINSDYITFIAQNKSKAYYYKRI